MTFQLERRWEFEDIQPIYLVDPERLRSYGARMRKIDHIEQQIRELSSAEFAELREWMLAQDWAAWDAKIERDSSSGKLDDLVAEAKQDYESGKSRGR
jgi:hypothetical protein